MNTEAEMCKQSADNQGSVVYGEARGMRIGCAIIAFLLFACAGGCLWFTFMDLSDVTKSPLPMRITAGLASLSLAVLAVVITFYSGPNRLSIQYTDRTYIMTRGFPFRPHTSQGTLQDMNELYLRERPYQGVTCWHLMVSWKQTERAAFRMQVFDELQTAQTQMRMLAERLGIPADDKPRPWSGW